MGLSDSDSEAGQSEGGADADADELLAAVNASSEEDLDDEELDQVNMRLAQCQSLPCIWSQLH